MNEMVVVGVLSGKGGVGKTTVTSNIAASITNIFKRKSIILDANATSSHIRLHFGMYNDVEKTLRDVMKNEDMLKKAILSNSVTGVDIVPSPENLKNLDLEKLKSLASELASSDYDVVVIDSSPGFGQDVEDVIRASNKVVVVTNPHIPDVSDALKIVEMARKQKRDVVVVVNRLRNKKFELDSEQIKKMLDVKHLVEIPEDDKVPESVSRGVPVVVYSKGSKASIALKKLAASLIDEEYHTGISDRVKWFFRF